MIWLIGNKGMLGTELEELLKKTPQPYLASDREIDITNPDGMRKFVQDRPLAWIINCAAYTAVDRAEEEPELAFRLNADGARHIAAVAAAKQAKLIHISTDYIFDGSKDAPCCETDDPRPTCVYGASKYQGERDVADVLAAHFIIRSAWLYGQHGPNFVSAMLRLFREKKEVPVVADQWGSPTYAGDLAAAILRIIQVNSAAYGIYHFTNAGRITWHDFAVAIYALARARGLLDHEVNILPITTAQYPTKARRPQYAYLSKDKICRKFDIKLRPWQDPLADFIATLPLAK